MAVMVDSSRSVIPPPLPPMNTNSGSMGTVNLSGAETFAPFGQMDVQNSGATGIEKLKLVVMGQVGKVRAVFSRTQSWADFAAVSVPPNAPDQIAKRMKANMWFFRWNYLALYIGMILLSIVFTPSLLIFGALMLGYWAYFLHKSADPLWRPAIGSYVPSKGQRLGLSIAGTGLLCMFFAGSMIFSIAGICVLISGVHAALNSVGPVKGAVAGGDGAAGNGSAGPLGLHPIPNATFLRSTELSAIAGVASAAASQFFGGGASGQGGSAANTSAVRGSNAPVDPLDQI